MSQHPSPIRIAPLTRIEGHAALDIYLDDAGNVSDTRMVVTSLRGFEQLVRHRPAEELPRIVTRICGICPWQHHLASTKAVEAALGIIPPPTAVKLRELCQMLATIPDKILHFYFLAAPDFLAGPDADPAQRSVLGLAHSHPELTRRAVKMRHAMQQALEKFSGKAIHPVAVLVGGFSKPLLEEERRELMRVLAEVTQFAKESMLLAREKILPPFIQQFKDMGEYPSAYLGTVHPIDGTLQLYDGHLRLMQASGNWEDFPSSAYRDYISEEIADWTWLPFPYLKKAGQLCMDAHNPVGLYRTNALARINVADAFATPLAQKELEIFRASFGRPAHLVCLYHWARLMELVYCCERAEELLRDPTIIGRDIRAAHITPKAGEGIGHVEAPRGTLIYHVRTDAEGLLTMTNIITGTTHNNAGMNLSMKMAAQSLIHGGVYSEGLINRIEMCLRAYDP